MCLYFDAVKDEAGLAGAIGSVNKDVAATWEECAELENIGTLFPPSLLKFNFIITLNLVMILSPIILFIEKLLIFPSCALPFDLRLLLICQLTLLFLLSLRCASHFPCSKLTWLIYSVLFKICFTGDSLTLVCHSVANLTDSGTLISLFLLRLLLFKHFLFLTSDIIVLSELKTLWLVIFLDRVNCDCWVHRKSLFTRVHPNNFYLLFNYQKIT